MRELVLSPTMISLWNDCRRKWAFRYVVGIRPPDKPSSALGTLVHTQLENYLNGKAFDRSTPALDHAASIARSGTEHLPPPLTPGMRTERTFHFEVEGLHYTGKKDVELADSAAIPGCAGGAPAFIDHKTTGNLRYVKSIEQLRTDTQAVIYAYETMAYFKSPVVDVVFHWMRTKGAKATERRHLRMYSPDVVKEFHKVQAVGVDIAATYKIEPNPLDLAPPYPNDSAAQRGVCEAYGGCPYVGLCTDINAFGQWSKPMTANGQDLYGKLQAQNAVTDAAAQSEAQRQAEQRAFAEWKASQRPAILPPPPVVDPEYAKFLASQASVPVASEPSTGGALPSWATAAVDPLTASARPAINPPEFQRAPTPEERALAETKPKRTRRTKAELAAARAAGGDTEAYIEALRAAHKILGSTIALLEATGGAGGESEEAA